MRRLAVSLSAAFLLFVLPASAQTRREYRGFWVDTFNTTLNNHGDVQTVVNNAIAAKANAIFAQVRRRADAWYVSSYEPPPDGITFPANFDPLQDLIDTAHAAQIEVHAYVIIGAVWNKNPSTTGGLPTKSNHVFNLHGGYDAATKKIVDTPDTWLTKTILPDSGSAISFQGHRFGNDFWIDLGHPAAAQYTLDVLMDLVRRYNVDGLHLDRIRYPDFSASGQTPTNGTSIGYNPTSVQRFDQHFAKPAGYVPLQSDADWKQWRRDQVTNFVRRLYLNIANERPDVTVSGSFIANGGFTGGATGNWTSAEAYWRVYQDWRAWTEEGIVDLAMPMVYKREHVSSQATMYDDWFDFLRTHQYNRAGAMGLGAYMNGIEGTLRQTRRTLVPGSGNPVAGVVYFSMANPDAAFVDNPPAGSDQQKGPNPFALPVPINTPKRGIAEFAAGLTTGKSVNGATNYEDPVANPVAIFAQPAIVPEFAWKTSPVVGHLMGIAAGTDTAPVTVKNLTTNETRTTATDGNGFFGSVDLAPARYHAKVQTGPNAFLYSCYANVLAGHVAQANATLTTPPQIAAPPDLNVANDPGSCSATVNVGTPSVTNTCGDYKVEWVRSDSATSLDAPFAKGTTTITWTLPTVDQPLVVTQNVTVRDQEQPVVAQLATDAAMLWPANHKMVKVKVEYDTTDNCGGVIVTSLNVASNEPINGTGDGDTAPDWEVLDAHTVRLRAERAATGNGRVYTITVTAIDEAGNFSTANVEVRVPRDQR